MVGNEVVLFSTFSAKSSTGVVSLFSTGFYICSSAKTSGSYITASRKLSLSLLHESCKVNDIKTKHMNNKWIRVGRILIVRGLG